MRTLSRHITSFCSLSVQQRAALPPITRKVNLFPFPFHQQLVAQIFFTTGSTCSCHSEKSSMAKMMISSSRILTPSRSLLFPSTHSQQSLLPPRSSTKPIAIPPRRPSSLVAMASSTTAAAAVVPDDVADVLGEVSIFTAAGEPVKFKDLWDQQEVY